ncbi:patatin-like phospholipase family protein [Archangium violaceum]|uniref:Uncharacterized protein n=1 Tax=Archangium violaceum Cb vi76 TaxID=1406225 RepID=A0A084SF52_9BACT|nr:patatin-like phospholipase family protein [Archangium violaceum]KFA87087.1 hypothetical protein Q664_50355 [Archangium violaceum Cb vi76]
MRKPSRPTGKPGSSIAHRLLARERRYLERARARRSGGAKRKKPAPAEPRFVSERRDLCGLALSGGGMRSATFNLGLLQGLHQLGLLEMFDYLATVSGGGYIGGFWTAWRHYHGKRAGQAHATGKGPELFPTTTQGSRGAKLPEVSHLREFSNFLNPRLGLTSLDTGRMIVATLSAVLPALLAALSLLILAPLLWQLLARLLLVEWSPWHGAPPVALPISYALLFLMTGGALCLFEGLLAREYEQVRLARNIPRPRQEDAEDVEFRRPGYYLPTALLATGATLLLWWGLVHLYHDGPGTRFEGPWPRPVMHTGYLDPLYVFLPSLAWLGSIVLLVILRWFGSRFTTEWMQRTKLAADERVISQLLLLAVVWTFFAALWVAGGWLHGLILESGNPAGAYASLAGIVTTLTALLAKAHQFLGRRTSRPVSPGLKDRLKAHLPKLLGYVTLTLVGLGLVLLIRAAEHGGWLLGLQVGALTLTVLTLFLFDPNLVGLHVFYRGRIARTFIGAAHGEGPGQTEPHTKDDLPLDWLKPRPGPLHLICCAANDLSSADPMASLYRGADSAVLSSVGFSVGKEWKSWKKLREEGGTVPTLAAAMTASGAAFNSHMGAVSMRLGRAVTFLMTAFNLRLGLWSPHPTRAHRRWYERLFVGLPFYKELLGQSRARSRDVLLSDGGHFENLALYELVRRHCRFILVSDCGMDSDTTFDDFANAVRRVREDFGVELRIDVSPLRAGEGGLSRQPIVVGEIEYPDGDTGVLLLLKPTLMGNEPPDIGQYKARNADFPHETTGDQFYDEAQWEAYRRLGEHAALTAFRPLREATERSKERAAQLFARARYDWMPVPEGYQERYSRFVARAAELDALLQRQESRKLFREVFKEINELDREAKEQARMREGVLRKVWPRFKPGGGNGHPEEFNPTPQELSEALHILRLALLFMEEVFLSENLSTHYNHPAYQGLMNYFARWAYSALFRAWWPLLKTQYSSRFTYFLEKRFNLPPLDQEDIGRLSREEHGFAMSCWRYQGGRFARDETPEDTPTPGQVPLERLISYQLKMPCEGEPQYFIQAAQLIARTHHSDGKPLLWDADGSGGRLVMVWQGDDFYVPPGLWGAGIREDFLRRITTSQEPHDTFGISSGTLMAVRILVDREASAARRHRWAEDVQFYRSHGFEEPGPELAEWLNTDIEDELKHDSALRWHRREDVYWLPYWLVRTYEPEKEASRPPEHPPEREGVTLQ